MEYLVPIVVALLGLAGTIAGLIFAYRKWLREQQAEHSKAFRTDRQAAYKQLWELAEQLNVEGRRAAMSDPDFSGRVTQINEFLMKSSTYLDDSDHALVNAYVRAARAFQDAVRASGDPGAIQALHDTMMPGDIVPSSQAIGETREKLLELRTSLLQKVRTVVGAVKE